MMEKWLLKFSKYNKKYYRFNHRQKKRNIKILSCCSEGDSLYFDAYEFNLLKNQNAEVYFLYELKSDTYYVIVIIARKN